MENWNGLISGLEWSNPSDSSDFALGNTGVVIVVVLFVWGAVKNGAMVLEGLVAAMAAVG